MVDLYGPIAAAPNKIAKVCSVIGTGVKGRGITTWALMIVKRVKAPT